MRIHDFGRISGSKVKISERIGAPLGIVNGSKVFTAMFRYEHNGKVSYEIVLSTFGPENYREICVLTFYMLDVPGACAQAAKFLGERNIDILNSVSLSMISNVCMVWKMTVDLSYYGDSASLKEEFEGLKRQNAAALDKTDAMMIEAANISDRFTKGVVAPGSSVKVRPVKRTGKAPIAIANGEFQIPEEYLKALEGVRDGHPVAVVADQDSWVLSITPVGTNTRLASIDITIPDKPGAIFEVTKTLADQGINLLSVSTKVLVYYETMSLEMVADVSGFAGGAEDLKHALESRLAALKGKFQLTGFRSIEF